MFGHSETAYSLHLSILINERSLVIDERPKLDLSNYVVLDTRARREGYFRYLSGKGELAELARNKAMPRKIGCLAGAVKDD